MFPSLRKSEMDIISGEIKNFVMETRQWAK
jgi:hypothetical protein